MAVLCRAMTAAMMPTSPTRQSSADSLAVAMWRSLPGPLSIARTVNSLQRCCHHGRPSATEPLVEFPTSMPAAPPADAPSVSPSKSTFVSPEFPTEPPMEFSFSMPAAPLVDAPSVTPSESPFVSPDDQGSDPVLAIAGVEILLLNCFRMTDLERDTFEATTGTWHDNFFNGDGHVDAVDNMDADSTVTVTKQIPDGDMRVNSVTYSHTLRYNALHGALDPEQFAVLPFTILAKNLELGNHLLRSSIPACSGLLDVAIEVASVNSNMFLKAADDGDEAGIQMNAVVGIVTVGLVFTATAILAAVFMAKRRDTKQKRTMDNLPVPQGAPPGIPQY